MRALCKMKTKAEPGEKPQQKRKKEKKKNDY